MLATRLAVISYPARPHALSLFSFNQGEKWIERFSVLSEEHLSFSKLHIPRGRDLSDGAAAVNTTVVHKWVMQTNAAEMSSARLREVFERFDADKSGTLDVDECSHAMVELNMFTTQQDVVRLFNHLDQDGSGGLDPEEFDVLAQHIALANTIVDRIPLSEVLKIEVQIAPRMGGLASKDHEASFVARTPSKRSNEPHAKGAPAASDHAPSPSSLSERSKYFRDMASWMLLSLGLGSERDAALSPVIPAYDAHTHEVRSSYGMFSLVTHKAEAVVNAHSARVTE